MRILIAAILFTAIALPAAAQTGTPGVDRRQYNQERRIDQGVQSGQLNAKETARLDKGQDKVEKIEENAKADGTVTKKEKGALHHAQEKQGKRIYRQKHDKQVAPPANGSGG